MLLNKQFRKPVVLVICVFCMVILVSWTVWTQEWTLSKYIDGRIVPPTHSTNSPVDRIIVSIENDTDFQNETKYILLWTSFFSSKNWELEADILDEGYFDRVKCNISACVITSNRDLLPSTLDYDALLFHAALPWETLGQIPDKRQQHQSYVMAILESPVHTRHDLAGDRDFFNMTMTYRRDSDVMWNYYGAFVDRVTGEKVAPLASGRQPVWRQPDENFFDQSLLDQATKKSKMGAWFASNCNVPSHRDDLVKGLQRHFSVDVYGKCGPFQCPRFTNHCNEILDKDYKFYMAFENSLCDDYVTEKFFGTMKRLIVPVVYGGADYSLFAPPHSYVDANDYASVEDLAKYLLHLAENPREYIKYFWWRQHYRVEEPTPYCDLCQQLHTKTDQRQIYRNIKDWWTEGRCKSKARIKF